MLAGGAELELGRQVEGSRPSATAPHRPRLGARLAATATAATGSAEPEQPPRTPPRRHEVRGPSALAGLVPPHGQEPRSPTRPATAATADRREPPSLPGGPRRRVPLTERMRSRCTRREDCSHVGSQDGPRLAASQRRTGEHGLPEGLPTDSGWHHAGATDHATRTGSGQPGSTVRGEAFTEPPDRAPRHSDSETG
jgi:hypothetical protein